MLASIFLSPSPTPPITITFPTLEPSKALLRATQGIIFSEGIYDIDLLIASFPNYKSWFLANTFSEHDSYAPFNTTAYTLRPEAKHVHWLIMHSHSDTLVDICQSKKFYKHLTAMVEDPDEQVKWDESLEEDHDEVLEMEEYAKVVAGFVLGHCKNKKSVT